MTERRHVVLWGPPGSGKTTVGRALAVLLGVPFVDLDEAVAATAGLSVSEIFEQRGEAAFRAIESSVLLDLLHRPSRVVIASGGGTLAAAAVRDAALRMATVIGLRASMDVLAQRTSTGTRPLLASADDAERRRRLEALVSERRRAYALNHFSVDASAAPTVVAAEAARTLEFAHPLTVTNAIAYSARIVTSSLADAALDAARSLEPSSLLLVTDENVAPLHARPIFDALARVGVAVERVVLPAGEPNKDMAHVLDVLRALSRMRADRGAAVFALGGGVVTDMAGLAASLYARGVRWVAAPTTMIGMVDAAIGGKTGVNLDDAKNAVGTFHHPAAVLIDPSVTSTESDRAVASGLAEVVKCAAVADEQLWSWLEASAPALRRRELSPLTEATRGAVRIKTRIVEADPEERGVRALLNFGHTLGHAIESATGYRTYTHGEAVALGMVLAGRLGVASGITPSDFFQRLLALLEALALPTVTPPDVLRLALGRLDHDKKRELGRLRFVLAERSGAARVTTIREDQLREVFHECEPPA